MEYVPINIISINNECVGRNSKRNIDQTILNRNQSLTLSNKRTCAIEEEVKLYLKDSIQSLNIYISNNDFEHAIGTESMTNIQTHRRKAIPIIFHFASEEILDIENYELKNRITKFNSINSTVSLPILSMNEFQTISMKKSSQLNRDRDNSMITGHAYDVIENDPLCQSEINSSHSINITEIHNSLLSTSNTSLDRSLECLQDNYYEHLVRKEEDMKSSIYQQPSRTMNTQTYIKCRKHYESNSL